MGKIAPLIETGLQDEKGIDNRFGYNTQHNHGEELTLYIFYSEYPNPVVGERKELSYQEFSEKILCFFCLEPLEV